MMANPAKYGNTFGQGASAIHHHFQVTWGTRESQRAVAVLQETQLVIKIEVGREEFGKSKQTQIIWFGPFMRPWTRPGWIVKLYNPLYLFFSLKLKSMTHFSPAICVNTWSPLLPLRSVPVWGGDMGMFFSRPLSWEHFQNQKINEISIKAGTACLKKNFLKYSRHLKSGHLPGYLQRIWLRSESLWGLDFALLVNCCEVPELLFAFMVKLLMKEEEAGRKRMTWTDSALEILNVFRASDLLPFPWTGSKECNKCVPKELLSYFKSFLRLLSPFNLHFFFVL